VPSPRLAGATAFVASSLYILVPASWLGVALGIALLAAMAVAIARWSRSALWTASHRFALAAGVSLTYAWLGFVVLSFNGTATTINVVGQAALALAAVTALAAVARRLPRPPSPSRARPRGRASAGALRRPRGAARRA
jgi:hypothetical protein